MNSKPPRPKKCRNPACGQTFTPQRMGQHVCSPACGLAIKDVNQDKAKKAIAHTERLEHKAAKEKVKRKADYAKEAQTAINRYVRLRDRDLGCVSCEKGPEWGGQWHCSHFRSVGSAPHLRFNLLNMQKSCSVCNNHLSGNISSYKPELVRRIGADKVDWLERFNEIRRYDVDYLKRIKKVFNRKSRRLERYFDEMPH